jgi:23S rRNA pseudouridine2605 synthase
MAKKTKKSNETGDLQPVSTEPELDARPETKIEDPIGDETDGEAEAAIEPDIESKTEAEIEAEDSPEPEDSSEPKDSLEPENSPEPGSEDGHKPGEAEAEPEFNPKPRPPAKLDRLQKILAQAGVASRRKAEELIEQGRVQVNGKIVTELGTKADAARDHIRVDGKLLQGPERLRYFVLNKPRGFVTTVKDPEGRPTVMQFFDRMRERLYPVGRLDYMSEGLLLVTNDGELANRLTRAAAGVEKTYLVKVAGQPSEAELDILRGGVSIERGSPGPPQTGLRLRGGGKPGSDRVRTSPVRIRQVRQGDNPWYEVVLIEGRNRELRKMFEEIGHFVEKIRRVGYGPLVLDQEPGNLRELDPQELEALRKVAEGKLRTPKAKELRRRNIADSLPPEKPASRSRTPKAPEGAKDYRPKRSFAQGSDKARPARPSHPASGEFRPTRSSGEGYRPSGRPSARPTWQKDDRPTRPPTRFAAGSTRESRPTAGKPFGDRPAAGRTYGSKPPASRTYGSKPPAGRTYGAKPAWKKPEARQWPPYKRPPGSGPAAPRSEADEIVNLGPKAPSRLHIEPIEHSDRSSAARPSPSRSNSARPSSGRSTSGSSNSDRSSSDRSAGPFRGEGGLSRPFTTSSGKPRAGGARPSSKPGKPSSRSYGAGPGRGYAPRPGGPRAGSGSRPSSGAKRPFDGPSTGYKGPPTGSGPRPSSSSSSSRPYTPREEGASESRPRNPRPYPNSTSRAERKAGPGWKPKPSYGGPGKPSFGARSKPKPGSSAKSAYKSKPGGPRRTGAPGGKRRS